MIDRSLTYRDNRTGRMVTNNYLKTSVEKSERRFRRLSKVRKFLNMINHNEPICFHGNNIDFSYAEDVYNSIIELVSWIDPELVDWIKNMDSVMIKINNAKKI